MKLTELECANCGAPLKAENVVERLAMARCNHCGGVFALDTSLPGRAGEPAPTVRPKVSMPASIEMEDFGQTLEIRRRWFSLKIIFLIVFCVMWNGFMIVWHSMAIASGAWFMSLFGILHTAVGLGLAYYVIASLFNTTTITVGRGTIEVRHRPIPWWGNQTIVADDVSQFFCKRKKHSGKNGVHYTYAVYTIDRPGTQHPLLKGLDNADQALFIEQELERHLRLEDQPVRGEYGR